MYIGIFFIQNIYQFKQITWYDVIMSIKIIVTGGTFDKEYNELTGELYFSKTHVPEMLSLGRCRLPIELKTLMMCDSLLLTQEDISCILKEVQQSVQDKILVTHGTDKMVSTAKVLGSEIHDKTVVLTGAIIPYAFGSSDGMFNLGSALAFVQSLPNGVYVAMNGRYFNYDNVYKNKQNGNFEEIINQDI
jgi:L-asparaginase